MLLVQKDKAGSLTLRRYYEGQMKELISRRQIIRERLKLQDELKLDDQMTYYSTWWYLAIHILVALPGLHTPSAIAARLGLDIRVVQQALKFLPNCGLVVEKSGEYQIGARRIHLGERSCWTSFKKQSPSSRTLRKRRLTCYSWIYSRYEIHRQAWIELTG